jgi:3-deoxy-7-phosphoheptulonate synthase
MIIVLEGKATESEVGAVVEQAERFGSAPSVARAGSATVVRIRLSPDHAKPTAAQAQSFRALPGVRDVMEEDRPYVLASREFKQTDTLVQVRGVTFGGKDVVLIAGPCAVESREQIFAVAKAVKAAGGRMLRGGAFKPRTSPYTFQGMGEEGLSLLHEVSREFDLPVVTEVLAPEQAPLVAKYADMLQIGSRNSQYFALLKAAGRTGKPVLLKRGMASEVDELLASAEYVLSEGNDQVVLCERGIRTFEPRTRFTLDVVAVPLLRRLTHLPVIVDPSHATGIAALVPDAARAAVGAGAHGLLIETHPVPREARSDGAQALSFADLADLMPSLKGIAAAVGRRL